MQPQNKNGMKKISTLFLLILFGSAAFSQTESTAKDSIDQSTGEKIKVVTHVAH